MRLKQIKLVRFVVAFYVIFSLALLPLFSQRTMASHHIVDGRQSMLVMDSDDQSQHQSIDGSCEKKSGKQSSEEQMNCCDTNCESFAAFETSDVPAIVLSVSKHFETEGQQLASRMVYKFMRPPRA